MELQDQRDRTATTWDENQVIVLFTGDVVKKPDIKGYFNEYYQSAVNIYNRFKRFGLPFAGGWAEQPEYILRICELFDSTMERYQEFKRKK